MENKLDLLFAWQTVANKLGQVKKVMTFFMDETEQKQLMYQVEQTLLLPYLSKKVLSPQEEVFRDALISEDPECYYQAALRLDREEKGMANELLLLAIKQKHAKAQLYYNYSQGLNSTILVVSKDKIGWGREVPFSSFDGWEIVRETIVTSNEQLETLRNLQPYFQWMHTIVLVGEGADEPRSFLIEHGYVAIAGRSKLPYGLRFPDRDGKETVFVCKDFVQ